MDNLLKWPFDGKLLGRKKNVLRRELLAKTGLVEKRIAVLGGSTTHDVIAIMELFLLDNGIKLVRGGNAAGKGWPLACCL